MAYERDQDRYTRGAGAIAAFDRNPRRAARARARSAAMLRRDAILSGITYGANGGLAGLGRTKEDEPQAPHNQGGGGGGGSGSGGGWPKPPAPRPTGSRTGSITDRLALAKLRVMQQLPVRVPDKRGSITPPPPPPPLPTPPPPITSTTPVKPSAPKPVVVGGGGGSWNPPPLPPPVDLPPPITTVIEDPAVTPGTPASSNRGIFILAAIIGGAWLLLREEES